MNNSFTVTPIGVIHSPFTDKKDTPIQASRSSAMGWVDIYPKFQAGLQDLEGFSHIYLLYGFHRSTDFSLIVRPFLDDIPHGLFATRHPCRPNPLGLSIVHLLNIRETRLEIEGVDVLDGTPLLDIKPYVPDFDQPRNVRTGWYATRSLP